MEKSNFVKYFCKCGYIYNLEIEEDEFTTKVWCPKCHKKMYKVKNDN